MTFKRYSSGKEEFDEADIDTLSSESVDAGSLSTGCI